MLESGRKKCSYFNAQRWPLSCKCRGLFVINGAHVWSMAEKLQEVWTNLPSLLWNMRRSCIRCPVQALKALLHASLTSAVDWSEPPASCHSRFTLRQCAPSNFVSTHNNFYWRQFLASWIHNLILTHLKLWSLHTVICINITNQLNNNKRG